MKTFNIRFQLNVDMNIEIEANSYEEALDEMNKQGVRDLFESGSINNAEITDSEVEKVESETRDIFVEVSAIEWDLDDEDSVGLLNELPKEDELKVNVFNPRDEIDEFDIEEAIGDEITYKYGYCVKSFKYKEIKKN